jgi:hypothetical protein
LCLILRSTYVTLQLLAIFVWQSSPVVQHLETIGANSPVTDFFLKTSNLLATVHRILDIHAGRLLVDVPSCSSGSLETRRAINEPGMHD